MATDDRNVPRRHDEFKPTQEDTRAFLQWRNLVEMRRRGHACIMCGEAPGEYISLRTGDLLCRACHLDLKRNSLIVPRAKSNGDLAPCQACGTYSATLREGPLSRWLVCERCWDAEFEAAQDEDPDDGREWWGTCHG